MLPAPATPALESDERADRELVERLRRDDTAALNVLLRRYWGPLLHYLVRLIGSLDAAEDICQRTFCQLWERRREWKVTGSLGGLIYRIARNFAISEHRHHDSEVRAAEVLARWTPAAPTPLDVMESAQLREELSRAIDQLPARRREVFVLRCVHELSYKDIAEIMGTSTQTVANQLSHALATLRLTLAHRLD
jgi:RNA polymerase sigma-70 factor (ECF subfamily)